MITLQNVIDIGRAYEQPSRDFSAWQQTEDGYFYRIPGVLNIRILLGGRELLTVFNNGVAQTFEIISAKWKWGVTFRLKCVADAVLELTINPQE